MRTKIYITYKRLERIWYCILTIAIDLEEVRGLGHKDTVTETYMEQNIVFADAFNYYIFGGQQVIRPNRLRQNLMVLRQKADK